MSEYVGTEEITPAPDPNDINNDSISPSDEIDTDDATVYAADDASTP